MAGMDWLMRLQDQVSGPAGKATKSLRALETQMRAVDKATGATRVNSAGRAINDKGQFVAGAGGGGGLDGLGAALGPAGALAESLAKVAAVAAAATLAVAALGFAFGKAAFEAIAFRENTIGGLAIVLKSATAAEGVFRTGMNLALRFNLDPQQTIASLHELVSKGFKPDDARIILTAMADLKVISPKANVDALILAMSQIKSKGVLQMEELQGQMAEAGLPIGKVLDQLAKKFGKTSMDIRKMIAAGQISGDEGIFAIVAAIKDLGGGDLGASADKAANSLSGMFNGIKFRAGMIWAKIADALGDAPTSVVGSVRAAMSALLEASNPEKSPAMKSLIGAFTSLFEAMFDGLGELGGKGGVSFFSGIIASIASGIASIASVIAYVRPLAVAFLVGFGEGFGVVWQMLKAVGGAIWTVVSAFSGLLGNGTSAADVVRNMARVLGFLAGALVVVAAVIVGVASAAFGFLAAVGAMTVALGTWLYEAVNGAIGSLMGLGASAFNIGADFVQGLIDGITSKVGMVTSVLSGLGGAAISQVRAVFDTHSPSRVMEGIGGNIAEGMAIGIDGGSPDVNASMRDLANPGAVNAGALGGGNGGASHSVSIGEMHIHIEGGGSNDEELGAKVAARVKRELVGFFDGLSIESGRTA